MIAVPTSKGCWKTKACVCLFAFFIHRKLKHAPVHIPCSHNVGGHSHCCVASAVWYAKPRTPLLPGALTYLPRPRRVGEGEGWRCGVVRTSAPAAIPYTRALAGAWTEPTPDPNPPSLAYKARYNAVIPQRNRGEKPYPKVILRPSVSLSRSTST